MANSLRACRNCSLTTRRFLWFPVAVNLSAGDVVGIVGKREPSLALARALVSQAATFHGPADLAIAVAASDQHARTWDWTKWLPHTLDSRDESRLLGANYDESTRLLADLLDQPQTVEGRALTLVVLDDEQLTEGPSAVARVVLQAEDDRLVTAGIVIANSEDRLPAFCNTVISFADLGATASLRRPQHGEKYDRFLVAGMSEQMARANARRVARFEDPELGTPGLGLPSGVQLPELLGLSDFNPERILLRWGSADKGDGVGGIIGVTAAGPFRLDLANNRPHALIGGSTGSGKSELLRTLVLSMATENAPERLTFVLIDFKGGRRLRASTDYLTPLASRQTWMST